LRHELTAPTGHLESELESSRLAGWRAAAALLDAFVVVHTPDDTEYAVIHPYDHWSDFAGIHYERAVTIGPMFRGMFWATDLGPGHLDEFDATKLQDLDAHRVEWWDDRALLIVATADFGVVARRYSGARRFRGQIRKPGARARPLLGRAGFAASLVAYGEFSYFARCLLSRRRSH
jgi:hypothetical protein